ncbi:putative ankyrin repeat protein RBE_0220 [Mytilus californianus]|uniref:putative ankyrin repeat protein RBE_0220 n=1 Tax=Mytilus californianus TaxID=6549 RepID=UPI002245CC52|nr:putative ankyrin repeat protein RBE_0220 [Mytilus californianus]
MRKIFTYQSDIKCWEPIMEDIKKNPNKKQTKILAACRLQVYQDEKFESLSIFKSCVCNMLSENICLSKTEKKSIAKLYLNAKASEISDFYDIYDCFPLLCKLYHDNPELIITDFFQNPFSIYEAEIDNFLKKGHYGKYCALALCVMFNNKLKEEMLTEQVNEETRIIIENTCEACRLDRGTSRLVLQDELDSLTHTFIKKEQNMYKILHDKIFDFLAKIYGKNIIYCLIRNADSGLIKERFLLETKDNMDPFITIIPKKYHQMYIQRMIDDWSNGKLQDVFSNINMKIPQFRQKLLCYLKTLDISNQTKLANICDEHKSLFKNRYSVMFDDEDTYETSLLHCCYLGDISLVKWCCDHGVDVNRCSSIDQSPIMKACEHGHIEIVNMLLDRGADYNEFYEDDRSPLMAACEHGHTEIVKMLLDRGADCNKCDRWGQSPVMKACKNGHAEIVKMLLDRGADCYKCDEWGQSSERSVSCNGGL